MQVLRGEQVGALRSAMVTDQIEERYSPVVRVGLAHREENILFSPTTR